MAKSTPEQVRAHIEALLVSFNAKKANEQQEYDFKKRVEAIAKAEEDKRKERKLKREEAKRKKQQEQQSANQPADQAMMDMMGFGGFGSSKK